MNRRTMSVWISFVSMQTKVATIYKTRPAYNGFFRPYRSISGPYNSWPTEMPTKKLDSDNATIAAVVPRLAAISSNPGRYMSMEKGPIAVSSPKTSTYVKYFRFVIALRFSNTVLLRPARRRSPDEPYYK